MKTHVFTQETLEDAASLLNRGGIVAFPTETVYGLGAVATDAKAVAKVFEAKQRPSFDPLIVHVSSVGQIIPLVTEIPEQAKRLMDLFWPGPLTIIMPKSDIVPDMVTSGLNTVAIRYPNHPVALELITRTGKPIAAPSANLFGRTSPTSAAAVLDMLNGRIDGVVDEGECEVGIESTVISFCTEVPTVLRPGGITYEEIKEIIPEAEVLTGHKDKRSSPGRSLTHYAPTAPMFLNMTEDEMNKEGAGQLCFSDEDILEGFEFRVVLSPEGVSLQAAQNLYSALRRLSAENLTRIYAVTAPEVGVGVAINDRLRRASINGFDSEE